MRPRIIRKWIILTISHSRAITCRMEATRHRTLDSRRAQRWVDRWARNPSPPTTCRNRTSMA